MINLPTAFISGVIPRLSVDQMYMGNVLSRPVRKKVTGISSNETVNDRRALPIAAERILGRVTFKNVRIGPRPRSFDASSKFRGIFSREV